MVEIVHYAVGNSHRSIPKNRAKRSRGGVQKTHDIQIFVDVKPGSNEDAIDKVMFFLPNFDPQEFVCYAPTRTKIVARNGRPEWVWRFATRQQVFRSFEASIKIRGTGGSSSIIKHTISFDDNSESIAHGKQASVFTEKKPLRPFKLQKFPISARFGLELELSSAMHLSPETVGPKLSDKNTPVEVIQGYREGKKTKPHWKIVPDGSLVCNRSQPDCHKFELVSPPLLGGDGLCNVSRILTRTGNITPKLKVNKSMGFHVHVDVSTLTTDQLKKVCQNFVKYEEVMDTFMPPSRRSGSTESKQFFKSNRTSVLEQINGRSNKQIHNAINRCNDRTSLIDLMNKSGSRYYKLNLQNLKSGRQPTIEFRQHSATMNYEKVSNWIRFCTSLVWNSAKLSSPGAAGDGSSVEKKFTGLFQFVIKDRALRDFYKKRRALLANGGGGGDDCACCTQCHNDSGTCESELP